MKRDEAESGVILGRLWVIAGEIDVLRYAMDNAMTPAMRQWLDALAADVHWVLVAGPSGAEDARRTHAKVRAKYPRSTAGELADGGADATETPPADLLKPASTASETNPEASARAKGARP